MVYLGECVPTRVCGVAYIPDHAPCGAINHSRRIGQSKEKPYEIRTPRVDYSGLTITLSAGSEREEGVRWVQGSMTLLATGWYAVAGVGLAGCWAWDRNPSAGPRKNLPLGQDTT